MRVTDADPGSLDDKASRLQALLLHAIGVGGELQITYGMSRPATAKDLADIERAIGGWIRETLKDLGVTRKQMPKFYLNLSEGRHIEDGKNNIIVNLDFGKLLPGERPPEMVAAAEELLASLDKPRGPEEEP